MGYRILSFVLLWSILGFCGQVATLRFDRAKELSSQGKTEEALQEYRAILLDDPENASAYLEAGKVRLMQKKWGAAAQNFNLSLQRKPELWEAAEGLAQSYEQMGQKEKAIATWRRLLDRAPNDYKEKAASRIENLLGNTSQADIPEKPSSARENNAGLKAPVKASSPFRYDTPEFVQGVEAYQAGNWAKSINSWKKVLSMESKNPGAFYYAGVCRYNLGEFDKAEFNLQKAFSYPDKGYNAHYYLARIHEKRKEWDKARTQYESYIAKTTNSDGRKDAEKRLAALPPSTNPAPAKLASADTAKKSTTDTTAPVLPVKPVVPDPEKVFPIEGIGAIAIGSTTGPGAADMDAAYKFALAKDFNQAIERFKAVRLQYPSTSNALAAGYDLAVLYRYLGLSDNLRVLTSAMLREEIAEPYRSGVGYLLASALKDLGELGAARTVLDSGKADLPLGPTQTQLALLQGQIAELQKGEKEIPAHLEKAIVSEKDPVKRADLRLRLAQVLLRQGMTVNAEKAFQDILESCSPYTADHCRKALYSLGDLYYQSKNWDKALVQYRKVTDGFIHPDDSPWGLYQIANIYRQKRAYTEAIKAYESLIQKYPTSYWADQAKWNRDDVIWRGQNAKMVEGE